MLAQKHTFQPTENIDAITKQESPMGLGLLKVLAFAASLQMKQRMARYRKKSRAPKISSI
jgi:hypothetical protein